MTLGEARRAGEKRLERAGLADARFDADCLLCAVTGCNKTSLLLRVRDELTENMGTRYNTLLERRAEREPLQYLLGEWDFLGLMIKVGRGVLIPRPETEQLALLTAQKARQWQKPVILDLCAGSGCIGLYTAKTCHEARVFLLEYEEAAYAYLQENAHASALQNIRCVYADIRYGYSAFSFPQPHILVSNPPYIPTSQLDSLQKEVQYEPQSALDGGADGLDFYRVLREKWFPALVDGGFLLLECGDGQANAVAALFRDAAQTEIHTDYNGIERILIIKKGT